MMSCRPRQLFCLSIGTRRKFHIHTCIPVCSTDKLKSAGEREDWIQLEDSGGRCDCCPSHGCWHTKLGNLISCVPEHGQVEPGERERERESFAQRIMKQAGAFP